MTETYDPTKDAAADGFKRVADTPEPPDDGTALSRAAWNAGQSGAPSPLDNPTFKKWSKRILWVAVFAFGFWIAPDIATKYQAYSAKKEAIEAPQADEPEQPTPPAKIVRKAATKKVADKATNTPATSNFTQQDASDLLRRMDEMTKALEGIQKAKPAVNKSLKDAPELTLPIAPIPPIPPQRSIP